MNGEKGREKHGRVHEQNGPQRTWRLIVMEAVYGSAIQLIEFMEVR